MTLPPGSSGNAGSTVGCRYPLEVDAMPKRTITRVFGGTLVALAAGLILTLVAGGLAYANGRFIMDGPDVVGLRSTPFTRSMRPRPAHDRPRNGPGTEDVRRPRQ